MAHFVVLQAVRFWLVDGPTEQLSILQSHYKTVNSITKLNDINIFCM